jgi:hypothetical protein
MIAVQAFNILKEDETAATVTMEDLHGNNTDFRPRLRNEAVN